MRERGWLWPDGGYGGMSGNALMNTCCSQGSFQLVCGDGEVVVSSAPMLKIWEHSYLSIRKQLRTLLEDGASEKKAKKLFPEGAKVS